MFERKGGYILNAGQEMKNPAAAVESLQDQLWKEHIVMVQYLEE